MSIVEEALNRLKSEQIAMPASSLGEIGLRSGLGNLSGGHDRFRLTRPAFWLGLLAISGTLAWYAADLYLAGRAEAPTAAAPALAPTRAAPEPAALSAAPAGATTAAVVPTPEPVAAVVTRPAAAAELPVAPSRGQRLSADNRPAVTAPAWVAEGRRQYLAGDRKAALDTWNTGFAALPETASVVALSAHPDAAGALAALSRLDDFDGAFVVVAAYRGKPAWRTLLFADGKNRRADVREAIGRLGIKGGGLVPVARIRLPAAARVADGVPAASTDAAVDRTSLPVKSPVAQTVDFDSAAASTLAALDRHAPDALQIAGKLAHDFPERVEPLLWLARAELLATQADKAEKTLAKAADRAPGLAEVWLLRGIAAQERSRHDEALGFLEEAYRLAPKNPDVLFNLALSANQVGAGERARAVALAFLELTRDKPPYAGQRAVLMRIAGR